MARPHKATVDYFPHDCDASEGKTLTILQSKYGNDGYAFWFKLLQLLGKSPDHYYDFNKPANWQFLLAKTHVSEDTANDILSTLAELDAIDRDLAQKKIIWCQHFVDNLALVYRRREMHLPMRPGSEQKPTVDAASGEDTGQENPEPTDDLKVAGMIKYYEEKLGRTLTPSNLDRLKDFADTYQDGWFEKAVDEAVKNSAKAPISYIQKILESWHKEGGPSDKRPGARAHKGSARELKDRKDYKTPDEHRKRG